MTKHLLVRASAALCIAFALVFAACKKDPVIMPPRTVSYILYTKENFSDVQDTIRFRLRMQSTGTTGRVLLDSNIAPMKVSEIPDSLHRLVFTKTVPPGHDQEKLIVGFIYDIDNVGESWYLDSLAPGQPTKTVEYSFR